MDPLCPEYCIKACPECMPQIMAVWSALAVPIMGKPILWQPSVKTCPTDKMQLIPGD